MMKTGSIEKVENPIETPNGEIIYELIGRADEDQPVTSHSLARIVLPAGKASGKHHHNMTDESLYILSGNGRIVIDDEQASLVPGECVLIPRQTTHQLFNDGDTSLDYLAICGPAWDFEDQISSDA